MESLSGIFAGSFLIALSGALMPGPLLTAAISGAGSRGWSAGPRLILGHGILELLLIAGLFLGLAPLLTSPTAFIVIALAGGAFLLWMAFGMARSLPVLVLPAPGRVGSSAGRRDGFLMRGALMSLANPYWIIWWATIGLGFLLSARSHGATGVAVFYVGHILADLAWYSLVTVAIHKGRSLMTDKAYRILIGICAAFLAGYGVYLLVRGIGRIA